MTPPEPAVEASSEELEGDGGFLDPTMLTFENGARVVLNPTSIVDNDVYLSGDQSRRVVVGGGGRRPRRAQRRRRRHVQRNR